MYHSRVARLMSLGVNIFNSFKNIFFTGEYAVRFIPRENGAYLVYVSFESCQTDVSRG